MAEAGSTSPSDAGPQATAGSGSGSVAPVVRKPLSIVHRMLLCFPWTIFGLVFFYLVMVFLSSIGQGITLERLEPHGWARSASRFTAVTTIPTFALFMLCSPGTRMSLFLAVMSACAQFCHFVIISSDLSIYVDDEMNERIFRSDAHLHPLLSRLPMYFPHVVGTIGFFAFLVITSERCFGSYLRYRKPCLPHSSRLAATYITAVFTMWLVDHAVRVLQDQNAPPKHKAYPFAFLVPLWTSAFVMWRRVGQEQAEKAEVGKQKKAD